MLDQVLRFFKIKADYDLELMKPDQSLFDVASKGIKRLEKVLDHFKPHLIIVQGDTVTTFLGALAGYYRKIKVAHVEAGLRSHNRYAPFPEEANRILTDHLADYHFAPTKIAKLNLLREGIRDNVRVVGNTGIDALFSTLGIIRKEGDRKYFRFFRFLDFRKKIILVTGHRRESFGKPLADICAALKVIAGRFDAEIVYPVHLNPSVRRPVYKILEGVRNIHLIKPVPYPHLVWLLNKSCLVLTDSGGIQEEAPSLGKPVLVMREVSERPEGIKTGNAKLVGMSKKKIVSKISKLLTDKKFYGRMAKAANLYGDGRAARRIESYL